MDGTLPPNGVAGGEGNVSSTVPRSQLPIELVAHILYFLDLRELVFCRQLSKSFRNLVDDSTLLQYKLNLAVARCIDGPCTKTDLASRLRRLQSSQAAWGALGWTQEYDFPVLQDSCAHISGSVLAQMDSPLCNLVCSQLPSPHRNIPQKDWKFNGFGFFVVEYAVDHAQDLLVLVKETTTDDRDWFMELVLLSLSTGEPHPLAPKTPTKAPIEDRDLEEDRCMDILISDNYIGMMVYEDTETRFTELWVWDWRTGDTVLNLYGDLMEGWSSRSFMFVAAGQVLVPTLVPEGNTDTDIPRLPLIDLARADSGRHTYEYAYTHLAFAIFEMPKQQPGVACARLDLFGKPFSAHGAHNTLGVPFYADPRFQLLGFRLWMLKADNVFRQYTLFVSAETFQRLSSQPLSSEVGGCLAVPWDEWAAETRLVPHIHTMHHAHLSHMRCVSAGRPEHGMKSKKAKLYVYDFASPQALRREIAVHEHSDEPPENIEYFMEPTVVDAPGIWAGEVKTGLPYKKTRSCIVLGARSGYQINEDCVVVRKVGPKETCEVWTF